jgi:hypothetical protein
MIDKEQLKEQSACLSDCPFCGGKAEFATNKSEQILIRHFPEAGVNCPARFDQYCESFAQGRRWWNTRQNNGVLIG